MLHLIEFWRLIKKVRAKNVHWISAKLVKQNKTVQLQGTYKDHLVQTLAETPFLSSLTTFHDSIFECIFLLWGFNLAALFSFHNMHPSLKVICTGIVLMSLP